MKKILWVFSMLLFGAISIKAQTVYLSQDFTSSTADADYIGSGTNQFDNMARTGTNEIAIVNDALRVTKGGGTGNGNRFSLSKMDNPFRNAPGGFLKFEMGVTVSGNTAGVNVPNGFLFAVGDNMAGIGPNDARADATHSRLYISPTATAGSFVIKAGGSPVGNGILANDPQPASSTSEPLSGPQKLVWYINNSGNPVGYEAPDGTLLSVLHNSADIWAIDANGNATLLLDEVPATTTNRDGLRQFKISGNDNFVATLDIDYIEISEEPVIMLTKITDIISVVEPVTAPIKTIFDLLPLPTQLEVLLEDGTRETTGVRWSPVTPYNPYRLGEYEVKGEPVPSGGVVNFDNLSISATVILRADIKIVNAFSPNGDGVNDTWIISDLQRYKQTSVEVYDRDGNKLFHSVDPYVGWDGRNKNGVIEPGSYYYIIKVPDLLMESKGVLTVLN